MFLEYAKGSDLPEDQVIASSYPGSAVGIPSSGVDNGRSNKSASAPSNSEPNGQMAFVFNFFFIITNYFNLFIIAVVLRHVSEQRIQIVIVTPYHIWKYSTPREEIVGTGEYTNNIMNCKEELTH